MSSDSRRLPAVVLVAALAAACAIAVPSPVAATPAPGPTAVARVVVAGPVPVGDPVVVRVTHLAAGRPVTVDWGDGRTSRRQSSCDARAARVGLARCARTASAAFDAPGTYVVRVRQRGRVIAARTVTVSLTGTDTTRPSWQTAMLDRVNAVRAAAGVAPLALCGTLTVAAQGHAEDMADAGYFSHDSADGRSPGDRLRSAGYDGRTWGENIAAGYSDVTAVMAGWVDSPGHYANLVRASFTHLGVGRADGGEYGRYWVQDFGAGGSCG